MKTAIVLAILLVACNVRGYHDAPDVTGYSATGLVFIVPSADYCIGLETTPTGPLPFAGTCQ